MPLPLPESVPNVAGILFSLWKGGYEVTLEPYSEEVKEQYYGYLGGYFQAQSRDEVDSD